MWPVIWRSQSESCRSAPYGDGEAAWRRRGGAEAHAGGDSEAIYDATGVRIRRIPFRGDRVLTALKFARDSSVGAISSRAIVAPSGLAERIANFRPIRKYKLRRQFAPGYDDVALSRP
jgi:hypothetical protein